MAKPGAARGVLQNCILFHLFGEVGVLLAWDVFNGCEVSALPQNVITMMVGRVMRYSTLFSPQLFLFSTLKNMS